MTSKISLLGWKIKGLRSPDYEVDLRKKGSDETYPVSLIQMPNGTGKTTTLTLLRGTLSGEAAHWDGKQIADLKRAADSGTTGQFILNLMVDDHKVTFELTVDFQKNTIRFRTTSGSGVREGFYPPRNIARFLTPAFVELFVFDGELAANLANSNRTRARDAIDTLFQLTVFDEIKTKVDQNWLDHVDQIGHTAQRALVRRRNRLAELEKSLRTLRSERSKLQRDLNRKEEELDRRNDAYNAAIAKDKDVGFKLEGIRSRLDGADSLLKAQVEKLIVDMRFPHLLSERFGEELLDLKNNLDTLKLPSSTSKEFFQELADAIECVCGREMNDAVRQSIRERAKLYLADEEVGVLNAIKTDIAKYCSDSSSVNFKSHANEITVLGDLLRARDDLVTERQALLEQRLAQGDAELEKKKAELDEANLAVAQIIARLAILNGTPDGTEDDDTEVIRALEKRVDEARQDLAEATFTERLKNQTEIATKILDEAQKNARNSLRDIITSQTNSRIADILKSDPVKLSRIEDSLVLSDRGGASVGQTLAVGYAFLSTLFNQSSYSLPFVVDSPAGALDSSVRRQAAKLIPQLSSQFVAFIINTEKDHFVQPLATAANNNVQYLTVFRETPTTARIKLPQNAQKTTNGVIVESMDFFNQFDVNEEN